MADTRRPTTEEPRPKRDPSASAPALPELLAPAGDWDCVKAAVENGADAVYFGLDKFNARMRADNFTEADLPRLMGFLHRRGVRGYLTVNTLVFENELEEAELYLRTAIRAGTDAAIVQDIGLCRLIRRLSPDFPIHASTQMTITSAAGVEFARELGCQLVVLARELSVREITAIQSALSHQPAALPLEVFVHGALCVAYSGQCLTSESLGGRSANRGECAQACRMAYDLLSDGQPVPLGDRRYLLSPQDLAGIDVLPELARAGVASLKIEGRLKSPEYVANITRVYRNALDRLQQAGLDGATPRLLHDEQDFYSMEMAFSRGLYTGWFGGVNNRELVHARFGKKRGVYLGRVTGVQHDRVAVTLSAALKPGDGVVFDAGHPEQPEEGGRVFEVLKPHPGRDVVLTFGNNTVNFSRIQPGHRVWKTSDPALEKKWRQSFEGDRPRFQRPVSMEVRGMVGQPLTIIARDEQGHLARACSAMPLVRAEKQPMTADRLRGQLGRLGGTPFKLGRLASHLDPDVMLPISELNRMRRDLIGELDRQRTRPRRWTLNAPVAKEKDGCVTPVWRVEGHDDGHSRRDAANDPRDAGAPRLILLVRNLSQLEAALRCGATTIYCDFENPKRYRDAVRLFRTHQLAAQGCGEDPVQSSIATPQSTIWVCPPRIFKPGEEWQLEQVRSCEADGYLIRNYDHLRYFAGERCIGDFSLNVANQWSAGYLLERFRLERLTASYDLNAEQLEALLRGTPPGWCEITIHQHMPMFHMEHCVFCAFLSKGKDYRDCGRPCDRHEVKLRDRVGAEHPVKADVGCRNTVFNALAQTGAEHVNRFLSLGVRHLRIEFLNETPEEVGRIVATYRQLLRGGITGTQLWRELKLFNQLGVTRGQMAVS